MLKPKLSKQLIQLTKNYRFQKITEGMSPAHVYKLIGQNKNLYLKVLDTKYHGTTYDVEREKNVLLWLKEKLPVPDVLHFERHENENFLLMTEINGVVGYEYYEQCRDPERMIKIYIESIKLFQSINLSDCPFDSSLDNRLHELDYLVRHKLADIDKEHWEDDTPFKDANELYNFLQAHKPNEELVFSHGDFGDSNIFVRNNHIGGFIDMGRSGKADKWCDIAFCVRSIQHDIGNNKEYIDLFFNLLEIEPDWTKIKYYILLDELF